MQLKACKGNNDDRDVYLNKLQDKVDEGYNNDDDYLNSLQNPVSISVILSESCHYFPSLEFQLNSTTKIAHIIM